MIAALVLYLYASAMILHRSILLNLMAVMLLSGDACRASILLRYGFPRGAWEPE